MKRVLSQLRTTVKQSSCGNDRDIMGFSFVPWLTRLRSPYWERKELERTRAIDVPVKFALRHSLFATRPLGSCMFPLIRTFSARACHVHRTLIRPSLTWQKARKKSGAHIIFILSHLYIKIADRKVKYFRGSCKYNGKAGNFPRVNSRPFTSRNSVQVFTILVGLDAKCHGRLSTKLLRIMFNININYNIFSWK